MPCLHRRPLYLVEDDVRIRNVLIPMIEQCTEFDVKAFAETEDEAVAWLASHACEVNLVVLDVFLRQGTGLGVLARQEEFPPPCRIVVLTNTATQDIRAQCLSLGARAVFDKTAQLEPFFDFCHELADAP